jgi:hypothetical protein
MGVGWNERPESALHYAVSSFWHPEKKRWWSRNIRTVMIIILDMPVATTTLVTAMVIMVVSDISIVVVGGMLVRQRVSVRLLRSRWIRRAL